MLTGRVNFLRNQKSITVTFIILAFILARATAGHIVENDLSFLTYAAAGAAGCGVLVATLRNWRVGFYLFNVWLMFEDLFRKYMGNGLALFFGKDILAIAIYISLYLAIRKKKEKLFRLPFLVWFPLCLFVWLGALQIFNPGSPNVLYGLLGFKLDFFYIPMIFVGYALIRDGDELRRFLMVNAVLAVIVCGVGVIQGIVGNTFLNPATLAPELAGLGNLEKVTPISGQIFSLPPSVFVSTGRYALYLTLAAILMIGAAGYLLLHSKRGRLLVFVAIGLIGVGTLLSGARGSVIYTAGSAFVMLAGLLWGAPWRQGKARKVVKAVTWSVIVAAVGLAMAAMLFPSSVGSRMAFYTETLNPYSSASEVHARGWDYPVANFLNAFDNPNWVMGNGIGTASLGTQYVARFLSQPYAGVWTEEGYGELILEMGIIAPLLWIFWTAALLWCCWKILCQLRQTPVFPMAFAIFWYAFLLLYPLTFGGTTAYQNYVTNVFLWLLVGILFRLPEIPLLPQTSAMQSVAGRRFMVEPLKPLAGA